MPRGHNANREPNGRYARGSDPGPGLPPNYGGGYSSGSSGGGGSCLILLVSLAAIGSFFALAIARML